MTDGNFLLVLGSLAVSILGMLGFVAADAKAAFDKDPSTHTLSEYLKRWANESGGQKLTVAFVLHLLLFAIVYLGLHLVLQVV